jgi:hypothetical protein
MGETLGYHRKMSAVVFGEESPATKYLDAEIKKHGENEEVLVDEGQLIFALQEMHFGRADTTEVEPKLPGKPLYKTTIVIWSEFDPESGDCDIRMYDDGIERLARAACEGEAYCSKLKIQAVQKPEQDPDWDGTDFFEEEDEEEKHECANTSRDK